MTCGGLRAQLVERLDRRARGLDVQPGRAEQLGELAQRLDLRVSDERAKPTRFTSATISVAYCTRQRVDFAHYVQEEVTGNPQGLKASEIKALERLYRRRVAPTEVVSAELAAQLAEQAAELHRQVGVLIDRRGAIQHVIVGDASKIVLPDSAAARRRGPLPRPAPRPHAPARRAAHARRPHRPRAAAARRGRRDHGRRGRPAPASCTSATWSPRRPGRRELPRRVRRPRRARTSSS